jgi:ubiquinone/menaquinone biosynthesis C-methylase UbiE
MDRWFYKTYIWLTERLYDELAWAYDPVSWLVSLGKWDDVRNLALDYLVGDKVLEIGCGSGELLAEMDRKGLNATGLDPSISMHHVIRRKEKRNNACYNRVCGLSQKIPFGNESFDTIISTFPAGYIADLDTWREVSRILRSNPLSNEKKGRFVIVTWLFGGISISQIIPHLTELAKMANMKLFHETRLINSIEIPIFIAEKIV